MRGREHGQIIVLFALSVGAILLMAALLLDGAYAYVERRQLQDAGDAAALSAANLLDTGTPRGCSATAGSPPGAPRTDIVDAALASVQANLPGFPTADVTVTCPAQWGNNGVRVQLRRSGLNFFEQAVGGGALAVATTSTAVNGRVTTNQFSVVLLDPWKASWPNGRRGCPSLLFSGGPTVTFDGSIQIDSACPAANGGALATNGTASALTANNGAVIKIVGGYSQTALVITPPPQTGQPYYPDPLRNLPAVPSNLSVISPTRLILNNVTQVLQPGVYVGGLELRNTSTALLRPGIYVFDGGGLDVGAQATVCSISMASAGTDCLNWSSQCGDTDCGVLLFNRGTESGTTAMGQVSVSAGATVRLKAYDERAIPSGVTPYPAYRNLILWQDGSPPASPTYEQPIVALNGGGSFDISGTVYAPQGAVHMGGTSGGSQGSGDVELTLQFVAWDLAIQGNAHFRFFYTSDQFVQPPGYGLVE